MRIFMKASLQFPRKILLRINKNREKTYGRTGERINSTAGRK